MPKDYQEEVAQLIIDLGVEVDTHQDADAFVRTYTFNDAQLEAFMSTYGNARELEGVEKMSTWARENRETWRMKGETWEVIDYEDLQWEIAKVKSELK